eukprot:CAMPEP_0178678080 /NCGR_PEP_ID=MMETSP0698-20121128/36775_1 /TAXON_ID=265572 /ORGANISM="Extubocellulus spinifer, Strain CCMP396" /LENGTH=369 /DNA_ID=CAMNT_0020322395 /DNA_START=91 /DNA_END=1200 /DNA_ORIENTATION=+
MSGRETKRPRIAGAAADGPDTSTDDATNDSPSDNNTTSSSSTSRSASLPHLTPDIWATVMPFLPYGDNLNCTAVNRSFLNDVAPRVKSITVLAAAEMKAGPARRFSGVESVTIGCLLRRRRTMHGGDRYGQFDAFNEYEVDGEVANLITPFLCLFPSLKLARAGGYVEYGFFSSVIGFKTYDFIFLSILRETEANDTVMRALEMAICGAYKLGVLSPGVTINGCSAPCRTSSRPNYDRESNAYCHHCTERIKSYPIKRAVGLLSRFCGRHTTGVKILLSRPEAAEYFADPKHFLICKVPVIESLIELDQVPSVTRQDVLDYLAIKSSIELDQDDVFSFLAPTSDERQRRLRALQSAGVPIESSDFALID